jgi:hypothetical protein
MSQRMLVADMEMGYPLLPAQNMTQHCDSHWASLGASFNPWGAIPKRDRGAVAD